MKAAQINEYGNVSVVRVNDIGTPPINDDQVLVKLYAASLNPFDTKIREGYMKDMIPLQFPVTLGGDIAGEIEAIGGGVTSVAVGDRVYGAANAVAGNSGALAEYAAASARGLGMMPASLDFEQAASLVLTGVSAVQAIKHHIKLQTGQKIFIHGGAGGIGAHAIQIAKGLGAVVATTATGDGINYVTKLGADEVIDYKSTDFTDVLSDYDAVFDTVGGDDFTKSLAILKTGGVAVSMAGQADEAVATERRVTAISQQTHVTTEILAELTGLIEKGVVTPHVSKVFPLEQIAQAFEARETSGLVGKIVVEIQE